VSDREKPKIVIITGPTASGKTSLAMKLALDLGGEIINADSMQVYRGMDIGTAKPTADERKAVPHHLLDIVNPDETFDAAMYAALARPVIRDINRSKTTSLVVGGTGLYIKSLVQGLLECPQGDSTLRAAMRQQWKQLGPHVLHDRLKRKDPESAERIHPHDRMRVIRALEIMALTKRRVSELRQEHGFKGRAFNALKLCLNVERQELYQRINERSEVMVEAGLADETARLLSEGYSPHLKPMQAIGYRHMIKYLRGDIPLTEAVCQLQSDTRRYAKRQITWFRGDSEFKFVEPDDYGDILRLIRGFMIAAD
jgi:tRNA dimethylallyltransferase